MDKVNSVLQTNYSLIEEIKWNFYTLALEQDNVYYKKLENKEVIVEDFLGKEDAMRIIRESIVLYDKNFRTQR